MMPEVALKPSVEELVKLLAELAVKDYLEELQQEEGDEDDS